MGFDLQMILGASALAAGAAWTSVYYAAYAVRSQLLGATDWHGRTDTGEVALTFDDGPSQDTAALLDVLDELGVKATFFAIGRQVERHPEIARRILAFGHEIGNHSYSHPIFLYRSLRETRRQLERTQEVITEVVGLRPRLARPPCGVRTAAYFRVARSLGLRTVQWSVAGFDWKLSDRQRIAHEVIRGAKPGSIILLHDGDSAGKHDRRATVAAVPIIIGGLRSRGLRVAPLMQLLHTECHLANLNPEKTYD